jgi:GNAT superfamily N-acetyltransferase
VKLWRELHPGVPAASLQRLFVHPEWRRAGVGRKLMQVASAWAGERGICLVLEVLVKDVQASL